MRTSSIVRSANSSASSTCAWANSMLSQPRLPLSPRTSHARRVLPLMIHEGQLVIATDDPADIEKLSALRFRTQMPMEVVLASPADLDTAIATHYPLIEDAALDREAERLLREHIDPTEPAVERLAQQKPIVRLVNNLLLNAVQWRASDIHLHPRERCADVRCRIDGSLVAVGEFNRALFPAVVARIRFSRAWIWGSIACRRMARST